MDDWQNTHARNTDPDTSHAAAARTARTATMLARLAAVYREVGAAGYTADEAAAAAGFDPADGAWKRVSDLIRGGVLVDTGRRRPGHSGRAQRVLATAEVGAQLAMFDA